MTIKDLAAKTGYAVGTVSRALNNHPNVSERARQEILEAAAESGFQLNVNAKQLKQHHSTTILVVVKGIGNELFGEMVESIQTLIAQTHYQLVVDYMDEDENEVRRAAQLCREKKPLGILFLGGNNENFIRDFGGIDVPCVVVTNDASMLSFDNLSSVSTDDREAACSAMDTLIRLGHSRIAIIGGDRAISDTSRLRYEGCMQSFTAHGIPFDPKRDYQGVRYSYQAGYQATKGLPVHRDFRHRRRDGHRRHPRLAGQRPAGAGGCVGHGRGRPAAEQLPGAETGHRPSDRFPAGKAQRGNSAGEYRAERARLSRDGTL